MQPLRSSICVVVGHMKKWADGVNVNIRLGANKRLCLLVLVGVTATGEKKLLAVESGYRESAEQWRGVFGDLIARDLQAPRQFTFFG